MIELFRQGFRLDVDSTQLVTFKKAINLNGIQGSYSYSNTFPIDLTANNRKLLDLPDLPSAKINTLRNGYEFDIVLNGSIHLKNQIVKITKESKGKADIYVLYSDSSIVVRLKNLLINTVLKDREYRKTYQEFVDRSLEISTETNPNFAVAYVETQSKTGQYVIEEMPELVRLQFLITKMFLDIGYTLGGDFIDAGTPIEKYYISPNAGIYQINVGGAAVRGFAPNFEKSLNAFDLLNQTLAYFNCYATINDTEKTILINRWTNLGNYKTSFEDYSKYFVDYQDFTFQSRLAKVNDLTYSESENTFNSFFTNPLSSETKATYLASKFGSGGTQLFDDSDLLDDGTIPLRLANEEGETSAIRIYKLGTFGLVNNTIFEKGIGQSPALAYKAQSVPMRVVYDEFHKDYTDFILTPLIQNLEFKYDAILATDFDLSKVFYIEQQAAYWIPLEISFSTKKDKINIRAMLIKARKVVSPTLNNFNSVLLDFKQKVIFTKDFLLSMYPFPSPNQHPWEVVIFKSYDQNKNRLFVNDVLVPANSLPQAFSISALLDNSIVLESNDDNQNNPNTLTDALMIQASDTNGGVSNEAYITLKHTGVAKLESNFFQITDFEYIKTGGSALTIRSMPFNYVVGLRPNINNTVTSAVPVIQEGYINPPSTFNLIDATQNYSNLKLEIAPFNIRIKQTSVLTLPRTDYKVLMLVNNTLTTLASGTVEQQGVAVVQIPYILRQLGSVQSGAKIKVYFRFYYTAAPFSNIMSKVTFKEVAVKFTTTVTV